jgi:hypothetical protein
MNSRVKKAAVFLDRDVPLVADLRQAAEWIVGHSPSVRTGAKNP